MGAIKMTGSEAIETINSGEFVILDVYADWCGPCKMLAPFLDQIADEKNVKIIKMDADANPVETQKFGVSALPTIIFYKDGKEVDRFMGFRAKPQIEALVDQYK